MGRALQYATDPWGLREPRVQSPFLSGEVQGSFYRAPSFAVPAAPRYPSGEEYALGRGYLGVGGGREVRTDDATQGGGGTRAPGPSGPAESAPVSSGGEVAAVGLLAVVAKLLGWW